MEKLGEILDYQIGCFTIGKILAAVVTFVVCYLLTRLVVSLTGKVLDRSRMDDTLKKIVRTVVRLVLYFITAVVVVDTLGVSANSLIAAFSVFGLAASLAVQDALSNLAGGIMILASKPFRNGDFVELEGVSGCVALTGLIHTKLRTVDNKMIYVPNSKIISGKIVNYTARQKRRLDIEVSASYDAPIAAVREALLEAARRVGKFSETPQAPFAAVLSYDDSSIKYVFRGWVDTPDYWDAHFAMLEQIKGVFDERNIEMTYNHLNVHLTGGAPAGEAFGGKGTVNEGDSGDAVSRREM